MKDKCLSSKKVQIIAKHDNVREYRITYLCGTLNTPSSLRSMRENELNLKKTNQSFCKMFLDILEVQRSCFRFIVVLFHY